MENIYEVLKSNNPQLVTTLDTNHDICSFLMGVYSHLLHVAIESRHDPKDMVCSCDIVLERLLKISARYPNAAGGTANIGDKSPAQRNMNLVKFLQVNPSVRQLALNTVYLLERWISEKPERKQQGFKNLRLHNAVHWKDHTFTAEIVVKFEFDEMVAAKMKWDMDEPEQPTEGRIIQ